MAFELDTDLIQQVRRATRAEAGLSHYDPTQKDLPPLPTISESVASFDPSPPYLRCKNCKGRLLRGVQSLLCIYCGRQNDVVPDPISYKDTFAYRWLLESLHLDGSETVGPPSEKGDSNRGQNTPKVNISLSELLDFKISWAAEEDKGERNISNKKPVEGSYLKFTGIDLDNFFHESRRTYPSTAAEEQPVTSNEVVTAEIKGPKNHDNLSFFEDVKPFESTVHLSTYENNDAFSGWEADFQSANSGDHLGGSDSFDPSVDPTAAPNLFESSKLTDPLGGSTVDISSQLDSFFGPTKDSQGRSNDGSAASPSIGDWTSDNLWYNSRMEAPMQNEQPDPTVGVKDALPEDNLSSVDLSLQLDSVFGPVKDSKDGNQKEDLAASPSIGDWTSDDQWMNLKASAQTEHSDATIGVKDAFPQDNMSKSSTNLDWFQVDQWQNIASAPANNMMNADEVLFDDWNGFTSSTGVQDSSQTAPTHSHDQSIPASESTSKLNLPNLDNNSEEMDFGSFSQADPLPRSSSKGSVSTEMNNNGLEVSVLDRGEGTTQPATNNGDVHVASAQNREDVEMLLSQMHDLSFMLENKLSLPPKSEGVNSFP